MPQPRRSARVAAAGGTLTLATALLLGACSSTSTTSSSTTAAPGTTAKATGTTTGDTAGDTTGTTGGTTKGSTVGTAVLSPGKEITAADKQAVVDTYAEGVYRSYDASVQSATKLQEDIEAFTAKPTEAGLETVRTQWLAARDDYGPTEAFRFYDGPIDDPDEGPEGQINAWPMDEAYVDYVEGDPTAGVINDPAGYPSITKEVLVEANEKGGETNISTGWHAIEFLVWGQDLSETGPGARPVTDYTTAANATRRAEYLNLLVGLLVDDLTGVRDEWTPDQNDNFRASFVKDPDAALADIFRGIGALDKGELAGERMSVAYETKDQEDEHSCFSDNTNNDVRNNDRGIQMVYLASFPGTSGPSPSDLVAKVDPALDTKLQGELEASVKMASSFPTTFDQMIKGDDSAAGRKALDATIKAIEAQGDTLAEAAKAIGLDVNFEID